MGTNGLAVASAVIGALSWFLCPFVGAVTAIIMGHAANADLKNSPRAGRGWATAGLILGYAHLVIYGIVFLVVFAFCGAMSAATPRG
jgi:hypothetical protein